MKQFFVIFFLSLFATGASLKAVANSNESPKFLRAGSRRVEEESCDSVLDIMCTLQNTKTFCEMVKVAAAEYSEFGEDLNGGANYTVFAPTDEAFAQVEDRLLKMKPNELYRTLLFHFYEGVVKTFDELACSEKLTSLTGDTSRTKCVRKTRGVYTKYQRGRGNQDIGYNPLIDIKTKPGCSGILHRVDHVMLPIVFKPFKDLVIPEDPTAEDGGIIINGDELIEDEGTDYEPEEVPDEPVVEEDIVEPVDPVDPEPEEEVEPVDPVEEEEETEPPVDPVEEETEPPVAEEDEGSTAEKGDDGSLCIFDCDSEPEVPTLDNVDFSDIREDLDPIGSEKYVEGTQIETPEVPKDLTTPDTTVTVAEETSEKSGPRIGALGINLIIFSTLLLCFVFVCMRR